MGLTKEELESFKLSGSADAAGGEGLATHEAESFKSYDPSAEIQQEDADGAYDFGSYLADKYKLGQMAIRDGAIGKQVMDGELDYQSALQQLQASDDLRSAQSNITDFEKEANLFFLPQIAGATVGTLPFMVEAFKGAAVGAGVGGAAGTPLGLTGPMAGLGASLGAAHVTSNIAAGNSYLKMREKGIPHDVAKNLSWADGIVQGVIESAQVGQSAKVVGKTAEAAYKPLKEVAKKHFMEFAKYMGVQLAEEEAQQFSELQFRGIAALASGRPDAAPTLQEQLDEYWQTFTESSKAFLGLYAGGKVTGFGAGKGAKLLEAKLKATNARIDEKLAQERQAAAEQAKEQAIKDEENQRIETKVLAELLPAEQKAEAAQTQTDEVASIKKQLAEIKGKRDFESSRTRRQLRGRLAEIQYNDVHEKLMYAINSARSVEERLNLEQRLVDRRVEYRRAVLTSALELQEEKVAELQGEVDKANIELLAAQKENAPTAVITQRLAKASRKLDAAIVKQNALNQLHQAMNSRVVAANAHGLDTVVTQLKTSKVQGLIDKVLRDIAIVTEQTADLAESEVRIVRMLLTDLVKASNIDDSLKVRITRDLDRASSYTQLRGLMPQLDRDLQAAIEKTARVEAHKRLKRLLKRKVIQQGKSVFEDATDAVFADERVQKVWDLFVAFAKDELASTKLHQGLAQEAIDAFDAGLAKFDDVSALELPSFVAQQVIGLKDKSAVEVDALTKTLEDLLTNGLTHGLAEKAKRAAEYEKIKLTALNAFQGDFEKNKRVPTDLTKADPSAVNTILGAKHAPSNMFALLASWEGKLAWAAQHSRKAQELLKTLDAHDHVQKVMTETRKQTERFHELLAEASPNKKLSGALKLILDGVKKERLPGFVQVDGTYRDGITLSPNEAVRLWLQLQDRELDDARIYGNKYSITGEVSGTSTQEMLEEYFQRDDRKPYRVLAGALQKFYAENFPRVRDAVLDETGRELNQNPSYSGYAAHINDKAASFQRDWQAALAQRTSPRTPGPTFDRTRTRTPLKPVDAFVDVYFQISAFEHWNVWRKASKPLAAALLNPEAKAVLTQKYGKQFYNALTSHFTDLVGGSHIPNNFWMQIMSGLMNRFADVMLLARPVQFFKQMTSVSLVLTKVNEAEAVAGFTSFMLNPVKAWKTLSQSDYFKNRYGDFMAQNIGALVKEADALKAQQRLKLRDMLGVFIKLGDQGVYLIGGHIMYQAALKRGLSHEEALIEAGRFVNTTQSSGTMDQLSNLARSPLGRMFTLLTQQPTRMLEQQAIDVVRAINYPTLKNIDQARRTVVYAVAGEVLFSMAGFAWASLFDGDDEDKLEARANDVLLSFLGPIRSAALIGPAVAQIVAQTLNTAFDTDIYLFDYNVPPVDVANRTFHFYELLAEAIADGDTDLDTWAEIFDAYVKGPNILLGGAPLTEPAAILKKATE